MEVHTAEALPRLLDGGIVNPLEVKVTTDLNKQRADLMKLITHHAQTPGISPEKREEIVNLLRTLEEQVRKLVTAG